MKRFKHIFGIMCFTISLIFGAYVLTYQDNIQTGTGSTTIETMPNHATNISSELLI
ncbi:MAG: hypothetical protein L6422_10250 [Candidatus Marinimicrobia bacterium]|nr:hypothetical protein [bacterium]MCG2716635.1 hypothetical protein [Candidatus Neomarinimicrobiota bacterium]